MNPIENPQASTAWLAFPILLTSDAPFTRKDFQIYLEQRNIQTRVVFTGNILKQPMCKGINKRVIGTGLPNSNAVKLAHDADLLIHEATFGHQLKDKAADYFHTTEIQAMEIADKAKVHRLILTHFSQRLFDRDVQEWIWNGKPCVVFDERIDI